MSLEGHLAGEVQLRQIAQRKVIIDAIEMQCHAVNARIACQGTG